MGRLPRIEQAVLLMVVALAGVTARAQVIATPDLNPLLAGVVVPALPAAATEKLTLEVHVGNVSVTQSAGAERIHLDAEVQEWRLDYQQALGDGWQWHLLLPWRRVSGGVLDGLIESWHHHLGLPNGDRAAQPRGQLRIEHRTDGALDWQFDQPGSALSDSSLSIGRVLHESASAPIALWLSVKLPTGRTARLTGSGKVDLALALSAEQHVTPALQLAEQLTLTRRGDDAVFSARARPWLGSGAVSAALTLSPRWQALAGVQAHTAAYDSALRITGPALQLNLGPQYQGRSWSSTLLITEDLAVDTAPDVQLSLRVARRW